MTSKRILLFSCAFMVLGACTNTAGQPTRGELSAAYSEGRQAQFCDVLDLDPECDLCEAYGFYADGTCDDFCPAVDSDCADPPTGAICGGIAALQCPEGFTCQYDGCDGADCAGQCVETSADEGCGGLLGLTCTSGERCVDVVDECDPDAGGADCPGVCEVIADDPGFCGGFAGFACDEGLVCVDVPDDGCDPEAGGADCIGMCVTPAPVPSDRTCGGFAELACAEGEVCLDDPSDDCDLYPHGGADCTGICHTPKDSCGGFAGLSCADGDACVDDPRDGCDPTAGGADCIGVCI